MTYWRFKALLAVVALAAVVYLCIRVVAIDHEREECGGVSPRVCQAVRESDEAECRAGEGCGLPLERKR